MTKFQTQPNCVACVIRPVLAMSFGIFAIVKPKCSHVNQYLDQPILIFDFFYMIVSFLCSIIIMSDMYLFFLTNTPNLRSKSNVASINLVYEIPSCNIAYFTINFYFLAQRYLKHTESLVLLVFKREDFGINSLLSKANVRDLERFLKYYTLYFLFQMCFKVAILCRMPISIQACLHEIAITLAYTSAYYLVAQILLLFKLYSMIIQSYQDCVTISFNDNQIIIETIQLYRLFYISLCKNYKKHIFCFGNLFYYLVLFLTTISIGVISYGTLSSLINDFSSDSMLISIDLCMMGIWFWYTFYLFCLLSEQLTQSVSIKLTA